MKCCIIRKVAYRLPDTPRIIWANVLCEREGLALLLVPKPDDRHSHFIVLAEENVADRVFEPVGPHRFNLETEDMKEIGDKLRFLGKSFWEADFLRLLDLDDL